MNPTSSTTTSSVSLRWTSWRLWKPALLTATLLITSMVLAHLMSAHVLSYVLIAAGMVWAVAGPRLARARRDKAEVGGEPSLGLFYFLLCLLGAQHCWAVARPPEPDWVEWEVAAQMSLLIVVGLAYGRVWSRQRSSSSSEVPTPQA